MRAPPSMRARADEARVRAFLRAVGRSATRPARLYLVGGATAVLEGWRASTIDIDIRLEPEDEAVLRSISKLKNRLDVNVELAAPPDFIPELPGWRVRSPFLFREGSLDVHHFDPYSQTLAKIERGFAQDLDDVGAMLGRGLVDARTAAELFEAIAPELFRYPAIDPEAFREKVRDALSGAPGIGAGA